ncbi:MAG: choice-of-anchor D domain-containing protein [Terriglobia bacterium]|jgi:subtilase family serine protease
MGVSFLAIAGLGLFPRLQAAAPAGQVNVHAQPSPVAVPATGQVLLVTLRGNTRPEANPINDRGRVTDELTFNHMMLQLQRTPEQEQELEQFINDLHDPASPLFHQWITAAEFGQKYGVATADVAKVTDWLESQGFTVNLVYPNQMVIDFTGSAGQILQAFHTEIHNLMVNGQAHIANMSDPQIPAALASTVAGVVSLNDFRPHPMLQPRANYTLGGGNYAVVPADLATIYNFNPAFTAGYSGQGQTIVLIEDTDLYTTADWTNFRSTFGLASAYPLGSFTQVHPLSTPTNNCTDPGFNGDDGEATIDVEWASAAAPSAAIELASCANTSNFGGFIALENLLNASGMPPAIVSISYGESESLNGAGGNAYINSLYQQGVTEGVSIFVSSGDQGAASSNYGAQYATDGITVSGFTSTPYNVSVGGTDFADTYLGLNATYWNSSNASNYGSAKSYIPEIPWNGSCANVLIGDYLHVLPTYGTTGLCNSGNFLDVVGGSGGPSACATGAPDLAGVVGGTCAGYAKPSWQSGFIGNPNDGVRDIPDVSLFASSGPWGHYYVVCFSDLGNGGLSCGGAPSTWTGFGGTSISSPIMAAIQALVNQASGSRWGNPDSAYYSRAATEYGSSGSTTCKSGLGNTVGSNCIFYDLTPVSLIHGGTGTGSDNDLPCFGVNCYRPSGTYGVLSTAPQTLTSAFVTSLGSGYTGPPSCALSGGGGSNATCSASTTGVVSALNLTGGGSGYTSVPTCTLTGGGGTGATCVVDIYTAGPVVGVTLTAFGSGYTSAPTCTISGGGGSGATCTATEAPGIAVGLTAGGSGYTTMPHCVLTGGGGTGGACAAVGVNTSDAYQPAFVTATGWDFPSGIGTVNASNLVFSFLASAATFSSSSLTFPSQTLNTSSAAQSVTVTNTGSANLTLSTVTISGTNASDFVKSADTCSGATVTPTNTCTVGVKFTPSALGSRSATLNFPDNAANSPQTVTLSGTGGGPIVHWPGPIVLPPRSPVPVPGQPIRVVPPTPPVTAPISVPGPAPVPAPGVSLKTSSLTFSGQSVGTSSLAQTVTLTNPGDSTLTLTGITTSDNFRQTNNCGGSVAAGASCTINVSFSPTAADSLTGALTITYSGNGVAGSKQTVTLRGTGTKPVAR